MKATRYLITTKIGRIAVLIAVSASVVLTVTSIAGSTALQTGTPGVSIIAQNGFNDRNNSWAWSMLWFKGKLYVGTGRDELCVEDATSQFFFPDQQTYSTNPSPNVRCTKSPYDLPLQAQIWQYTPASSTATTTTTTTKTGPGGTKTTVSKTSAPSSGTWHKVFTSPVVANPAAKGKTIARDFAYRGMTEMTNPKTGQKALFAAADTPDEFIPKLLQTHPPVILRSYDGIHWTTVHLPSVIVHFPNGNVRPMGLRSLLVWRGHLFATALPDITGDGALFEVTNPWGSSSGFRQVSGPQYDIFEIQKFNGGLYIGTGNRQVGYGVYRTFQYTNSGYFDFHQVVGDGAGRGYVINSVVSMHVYRDRLYVGASGWYNQNTIPASEMIRIAPDGQWTLVVGNPRNLPDGQTLYPTSGLYDGFFSPFAAHFWRMASQDGGLFVGTNDWAYLMQEDKQYAWLQETVLSGVLGFNIWATCDGNDWFAVTRDAFSGDEYNFGGRTLVNGGNHDQDLFIGSANQAQGTTIFDDQEEACSGLVSNSRSSAPSRPAALMTDSIAHGGTLLSWERSADAGSYTIEQAPFVSITLGLKAPITMPDGWHFEDAVPTVTSPDAAGATTVTLSVPGAFEPVATTVNPDYVTHTTGRYVYEVIANSRNGRKSDPSNVTIAPFPGQPATFTSLQSVLSGGVAQVANADRGMHGAAATTATAVVAASRLQRLINAAQAAAARGDDAAARRDIAVVEAHAGQNDTLAALAARVARRLQYARIAGAP